ncbi:MAG: carbohydrate ABC transporter permease [Brachybacterium sp.]|nr:carbohydrate ABC transporter permease [Brachybacterium sp.]
MVVFGLFFVFPFIWMIATSLKPTDEVFATSTSLVGSRLEFSNYYEAFTAIPFLRIVLNSALVAIVGAVITMAVSLLSAYAFARIPFVGASILFGLFIGTMALPQEVLIVPLYLALAELGLVNTYAALILPFAFGAFGTFLLRQFILQIPQDYEDAASIDGAGRVRVLLNVVLPLVKSPLAVLGVFTFIEYWASFLWPLVIVNDTSMATIPIGIQMFSGERGTDWGPMMAAITLVVIPSLLVVVLLQRQLREGAAIGGMGGR